MKKYDFSVGQMLGAIAHKIPLKRHCNTLRGIQTV